MTTWWATALSVLGGLLVLWLALVLVLWIEQRRHPGGASLRDLLRLAPEVARLLKRLASDRTVSIEARIWLAVLLLYLLSPIDLIPDFIPVLGYADDAIVVAIALRFATCYRGASDVCHARHCGRQQAVGRALSPNLSTLVGRAVARPRSLCESATCDPPGLRFDGMAMSVTPRHREWISCGHVPSVGHRRRRDHRHDLGVGSACRWPHGLLGFDRPCGDQRRDRAQAPAGVA
ncbi:DUF1232 domain-containing protein [Cryobacterium flavum]|uniref:DUF1232 domain-containing protein n=1 Tax=Cryobacterium flavum TaxID=1424659 RepID=A0ABY2HWP5_9MICO|nr:DUF1232 domain-containing protein [Cryobacterium flavum]